MCERKGGAQEEGKFTVHPESWMCKVWLAVSTALLVYVNDKRGFSHYNRNKKAPPWTSLVLLWVIDAELMMLTVNHFLGLNQHLDIHCRQFPF